jgi:hypothetical protein
MSTFRRWKEERIRHYIYLEQLKTTQNLSNGVSLNGARAEGRNESSDLLLQVRPDSVRDRRISTKKEKDGFPWMIVRLAILAAGAAAWFWLYHGQLGVHR